MVQRWIANRDFVKVEPIHQGWSHDLKFKVTTQDGRKQLLRISSVSRLEERKAQYEYMERFAKVSHACQVPIEFGSIPMSDYIYTLVTYMEGEPLEKVIETLSKDTQYELGLQAGQILRTFHDISVEKNHQDIMQRLIDKKLRQMEIYEQSDYRMKNDQTMIDYVKENIHILSNQPAVYQHGDFHIGNFIYTNQQKLGIIDFDRSDIGDPYEEFLKLSYFTREKSIPLAIGQIHSYFQGTIPSKFWDILKVYVFHTSLHSIIWAANYSEADVKAMVERYEQVLVDYEYGKRLKPLWWTESERIK